jgi:hypothetical protein
MRITTKAVWNNLEDFCAGANPDRWEGYEYRGEVAKLGALIAKLGSNLTNTGVQQPGPNPTTTYYPSPSAATSAASDQLPSADAMLGPDILNPNMTAPPMPKIVQPDLAQAQTIPGALTTKGILLSQILPAALQGAGAGLSAMQVTNPHIQPGLGGAFAAGIQSPFAMKQQQNALQNEQLDQQQKQVQIQNAPIQRLIMGANLGKTLSETRKDQLVTPRNGGVFDAATGTYAPGTEPNTDPKSIDQLIAESAVNNPDPSTNQKLAQLMDVKSGMQKQADNDPEFRAWQSQNPNGNVSDYFKARYPKMQINTGTSDPNDVNTLAQGMVDGTLGGTILSRLPGNTKLAAISAAKKLDPNFDMTNFAARQKVANDFASGKSADAIQSFNTFLGHAADLSTAVNDFRATQSPLINKPMIWLKKNSGDPAVASYLAKTEPVRAEFETFLQGNHALTESDKASAAKVLDDNASPAQMQATIKSMTHTAGLRLREVNQRYQNTMHTDYPGLVDPQNAQFLRSGGAASNGNGSGIQVTAPDGSAHMFPDQASANNFKKLAGIQ